MNDGEYKKLSSDNTFKEQVRIYPPGGIVQDLNINPKLIYSSEYEMENGHLVV